MSALARTSAASAASLNRALLRCFRFFAFGRVFFSFDPAAACSAIVPAAVAAPVDGGRDT
jgi:hypothetical protein